MSHLSRARSVRRLLYHGPMLYPPVTPYYGACNYIQFPAPGREPENKKIPQTNPFGRKRFPYKQLRRIMERAFYDNQMSQ